MNFSELAGKVVLVENTASLWGTTVRDFTQMNELSEKYGDKLVSELPIEMLFFLFNSFLIFCFRYVS
jgi:glutathione peroxidase-family protein